MPESTSTPETDATVVAAVLGGELREVQTPEGVRREVVVELPESKWDEIIATDVDELILDPVEGE